MSLRPRRSDRDVDGLDVLHATFATPDLTTFCRLDELGLEAVGQLLEPVRAVIECRVSDLAGVVAAVGEGVSGFSVGDDVLGWSDERARKPISPRCLRTI